MKFKLDDNLGKRAAGLFEEAGHEVHTVHSEGLQGSPDRAICDAVRAERLFLVTLDLDFADAVRFPPRAPMGLVVLRVPRNPSMSLLKHLVRQLLAACKTMSPEGHVWIVEWAGFGSERARSRRDSRPSHPVAPDRSS